MNPNPKDAPVEPHLRGSHVLILFGPHAGKSGLCHGKSNDGERWIVSPTCHAGMEPLLRSRQKWTVPFEILHLKFGEEFLLADPSPTTLD